MPLVATWTSLERVLVPDLASAESTGITCVSRMSLQAKVLETLLGGWQ